MGSKQQLSLRPISAVGDGRGFDGKANPSFRVYYSLRAGAVPFVWESAPGTPKRGAAAAATNAVVPESGAIGDGGAATLLPPISPPPSYQSLELKGRTRCRSRTTWPAGGIVRALMGMLGVSAGKSQRLSRRRHASYL
uniref:Uncharacterized protein n=1 Tax=Avena sativa TaxID=4498 RepID=A0ACD6A7I2_AVESA